MNEETDTERNTMIGTVIINFSGSYIYKWKFRIIKMSSKLAIGIVDRGQIKHDLFFNGDFTWLSNDDFVAYHNQGRFEIHWDVWSSTKGEEYGEGDIIEMKINTTDLTIEYAKNGKWFGRVKDAADPRYIDHTQQHQLAVTMVGICEIELVDFEQKTVD